MERSSQPVPRWEEEKRTTEEDIPRPAPSLWEPAPSLWEPAPSLWEPAGLSQPNPWEGERLTQSVWQEEEEPIYSKPNKVAKHTAEHVDVDVPEVNTTKEEPLTESKKLDGKMKEKLAQLRKQTEEEVMRMKEKTSNIVSSLRRQKEDDRGRSR